MHFKRNIFGQNLFRNYTTEHLEFELFEFIHFQRNIFRCFVINKMKYKCSEPELLQTNIRADNAGGRGFTTLL